MDNNKKEKDCACTQKLLDLARAAHTVKKSSLMKVTCVDCKKVFWSNVEMKSCFDCIRKLGTPINPEKTE
jgi:hypothetical protein